MSKENVKQLNLQVAEGISVNLLPNVAFEFLMTSKEVAKGYGVTEYAIRKNKLSLGNELVEGKHFVKGVTIGNTLSNAQPHQVFWTKRGVIRLGFAMRSERAKLFRDWAEELIITIDEQRDLFGAVVPQKALPAKRKHNRITPARMVEILADVAKIDDKELRLSLISKLGV